MLAAPGTCMRWPEVSLHLMTNATAPDTQGLDGPEAQRNPGGSHGQGRETFTRKGQSTGIWSAE